QPLALADLKRNMIPESAQIQSLAFHAFPTPWSYPLVNEFLIYEQQSTTALLSWQALLTLLALAPSYAPRLKAVPLPLNSPHTPDWLKAHQPQQIKAPLYLFQLEQHLLGFSWPSL